MLLNSVNPQSQTRIGSGLFSPRHVSEVETVKPQSQSSSALTSIVALKFSIKSLTYVWEVLNCVGCCMHFLVHWLICLIREGVWNKLLMKRICKELTVKTYPKSCYAE